MTLTLRLSLFFLAALAIMLAGFSTALYLLAEHYLYHQVDERLEAALDTLASAARVERDEVEWLPQERSVTLGQDDGLHQVRWTVSDAMGRLVERSPNLPSEDLLAELPPDPAPGATITRLVSWQGQLWKLGERSVLCGRLAGESDDRAGPRPLKKMDDVPPSKGKKAAESSPGKPKKKKTPALVLKAGLSLEPANDTLRLLGWSLGGLSAGIWLAAAALGWWVCRRALLPLTRMAQGARSIQPENLEQRLPVAAANDELAELGTAFNDLLARLHEAFERQQRFTGDASHQLRTPLTAVLGQIEVALRRERSPEEYRQVLSTLHGQASQLRQIVESLLFLARADAEARLPHLETLDLASWLAEHVQGWAAHPRAADLRCECSGAEPLSIQAQPPLLGQLLDNLWDNACKYSSPGSPITIRLSREAAGVVLSFADAGQGIAPEDVPHIFEPFYRTRQARQQGIGGVGLGLAVAQRIVKALGGSLEVESQVGLGSVFRIQFPRGKEASVKRHEVAAI